MVRNAPLQLREVQIKNFRCFENKTIQLDAPTILIQGLNGAGKTSLLEALHYSCYLRSFRTHSPRDLVQAGHEGFFVRALFSNQSLDHAMQHEVQVGFSGKKRLVKVDQRPVSSYKELMDYYRVITLTEDDLGLISQGPDFRRSFLDQAILLSDPEFITPIRDFKTIVDNRNAMLVNGRVDKELYAILTEQLWHKSRLIQDQRKDLLTYFENEANALLNTYFNGDIHISLEYSAKSIGKAKSWDEAAASQGQLYMDEARFGRSLFGAHLDDCVIKFQDKKSKTYASRGQQKLIILLLKIAHIKRVSSAKGSVIFLLDDFMTDFDMERAEVLLSILNTLDSQLIFTSPVKTGFLENTLISSGAQSQNLTG